MKEKQLLVKDVSVHEIAKLTPEMKPKEFQALKKSIESLGQLEPVTLYHGKIVDGRHRHKALSELRIEHIRCKELNPKHTYEEVREMVVNGFENRRHETPTQLSIAAMKEYLRLKSIGEKVSQGEIAENFGVSRMQIGRALKVRQLAGDDIIEALFNGQKINISLTNKPNFTDSLDTLSNFFKKRNTNLTNESKQSKLISQLTDDEKLFTEEEFDRLNSAMTTTQKEYLAHLLFSIVNNPLTLD